ncbi:transglutaminase-like domain-containing protein [Erythrobacter litoralis]|uniref:Transglutaminase-like n=1 Tax=Erythrobacter litoralis (strain HTCC2594) TaxID=314225 RepID=Q2NDN9_ERYLH|nr:transglutaminase family protein [Erythrobacter litoralis]ABC62202.1 Transglutaminase-like [Erythrobacter litoralis HTCC2594]
MKLSITVELQFHAAQPVDCLLQCEVAAMPEQRILSGVTRLPASIAIKRVPAQDSVGERFWITAEKDVAITYEAQVEIARSATDSARLGSLSEIHKTELPGEATQYLFDSRFCAAESFQSFVASEFAETRGGARIAAIREWIADHFSYTPGVSGPHTSARDSFVERRGVCRDYAHVMVALARASGIPARYASGYAPDVEPPDFHAVAEVFLADPQGSGGDWVPVDATGMAKPDELAIIGVGRDAADVSFLTSFGAVSFSGHNVRVERA